MPIIDALSLYPAGKLSQTQLELRQTAINDFPTFIRLVAPFEAMAHCHEDLCKWLQDTPGNRLVLWPRDHGKSRKMALYAVFLIVRDPKVCIMYASATTDKSVDAANHIKNILESPQLNKYFPGLAPIGSKNSTRETWKSGALIVEHPERKKAGVVDKTFLACSIGTTLTGKHCDYLFLDDIVTRENTVKGGEQARNNVSSWVAMATSLLSAEGIIVGVGTRYHPDDVYQSMIEGKYEEFDEHGEVISESQLYSVWQEPVERDGVFLWPRQKYGKEFRGFNAAIMAKKRAQYESNGEILQFFAQYYNEPNDSSLSPISRDQFKYYHKESVKYYNPGWALTDDDGADYPLYLVAAMDLAATANANSDYSVLAICGIDPRGNRYVLDIYRMRTDKQSELLGMIETAYRKWKFSKLRIEAVGGFKIVATNLISQLQNKGIRIPMETFHPGSHAKVQRMTEVLEPLYSSGAMYHFRGGNCEILEQELVQVNPSHDDCKDAVSMAVSTDFLVMPLAFARPKRPSNIRFHPKYGGVI